MTMLNPNAPEFVPQQAMREEYLSYYDEIEAEEALTEEELEELEAVEEWVRTMAALEEAEREHLITLALQSADPSKVAEIEKKYDADLKPARKAHRHQHASKQHA